MDVLKYLPRGLVHSWVLKKKERSGLNRARARRLEERAKYGELGDVLRDNVRLKKDVGDIRDGYRRTLGMIFLGADSFSGLSDKEMVSICENLDINGALNDKLVIYKDLYRRVSGQRDKLRERVFEIDMKKLIEDGDFKHSSLMIYNAGDVLYATPDFEKKFGKDRKALGEGLWKDKDLNESLAKRKIFDTTYEGRNLRFVPCRGSGNRNLAVAYIDYKHGKDNLNSLRAIRVISHYLNEFDLGMMGTASKERGMAEEAEREK